MKCPHCGVNYMDDEKRCPICGKRPGIVPSSQTKDKKKQKTRTTQSKAWQEAGERAKQHEHLEYYTASPQKPAKQPAQQSKKKKGKWGCLAFIIVFALTTLGSTMLVNFGKLIFEEVDNTFLAEDGESVFESCELTEVIPEGSWRTEDGSLMITVTESSDGDYLTWMRNGSLYTSEYTDASVWNLNADNVSDYYTQDELETYPLERYTQYSLMADGSDQGDDGIDWAVYRENDVEPKDVMTIDIYDYDTGEYESLQRIVSDKIE